METISWRSKAGWTRGSYWKEIESEMERVKVAEVRGVRQRHDGPECSLGTCPRWQEQGRHHRECMQQTSLWRLLRGEGGLRKGKRGEKEVGGEREVLTKPPAIVRLYIHSQLFTRTAVSETGPRFWDKNGEKGAGLIIPRDVRYPRSLLETKISFYG